MSEVYNLAQSILGVDFITPEEVMEARGGVFYTNEQMKALAESLPSEEMLKWCKGNGYAVMPAPPRPMSVLGVRSLKYDLFWLKNGGWFIEQEFAREDKTLFGWLAIKKAPVANSTSKNWNDQKNLLSVLEEVPNAAEIIWFITTYLEVRGVRLFTGVYVRTSSRDEEGDRVFVGLFLSALVDLSAYWDSKHDDSVGVSASRKKW